MLEQLKTGSLAAVDQAEPVANLVLALDGLRTEILQLDEDARTTFELPATIELKQRLTRMTVKPQGWLLLRADT